MSPKKSRRGTVEVLRTVLGLGVPPAPSFLSLEDEETKAGTPNFLALEDEETKAYDAHTTGDAGLSALLAKCQNPSEPALDSSSADPPKSGPRSASRGPMAQVSYHPTPEIRATDEWNQPPRIEVGSDSSEDIAPLPRSRSRWSHRRSFLTKFLFAMIMIAAAMLLASELSARANLPWLDPRPLLAKGLSFVKAKIPWERLPRVPGLSAP